MRAVLNLDKSYVDFKALKIVDNHMLAGNIFLSTYTAENCEAIYSKVLLPTHDKYRYVSQARYCIRVTTIHISHGVTKPGSH